MNQWKYNEYDMLRKESMEGLSTKENVRRFVITTTIAILTLSGSEIWAKDAVIYLILMATIILSMIKVISIEQRTKEIIAYRIVFLERGSKDIRWARAITKYEKKYRNTQKCSKFLSIIEKYDFFTLAFLCVALYINKFYKKILINNIFQFDLELYVGGVLIISLFFALFLTFVRININCNKEFENILNNWEMVKSDGLNS